MVIKIKTLRRVLQQSGCCYCRVGPRCVVLSTVYSFNQANQQIFGLSVTLKYFSKQTSKNVLCNKIWGPESHI